MQWTPTNDELFQKLLEHSYAQLHKTKTAEEYLSLMEAIETLQKKIDGVHNEEA